MNQIFPIALSGLGALIMIEGYLSLYAALLASQYLYALGVCLLSMVWGLCMMCAGLDILARVEDNV